MWFYDVSCAPGKPPIPRFERIQGPARRLKLRVKDPPFVLSNSQ